MVESSPNSTHMKGLSIESEGEAIILRGGQIESFHFVSPETDADGMRLVGALGEMLSEQTKKTFRTESLVVFAQNEDFNLIMFQKRNGFVVWKTSLSIKEALDVLGSPKDK